MLIIILRKKLSDIMYSLYIDIYLYFSFASLYGKYTIIYNRNDWKKIYTCNQNINKILYYHYLTKSSAMNTIMWGAVSYRPSTQSIVNIKGSKDIVIDIMEKWFIFGENK